MDALFQPEDMVLVFTDVVKSTELIRIYPVAYLQAQGKHHIIIRDTLANWQGAEINTTGDGFFLTFHNPSDAAQWAKETQALLLKEVWPSNVPFQMRIGMHIGSASRVEHPNGRVDYYGDAVNLAARIAGEAQGGQVCVSQAFYEHTRRELPAPFGFLDRGQPNLKGIGPTRVWQLMHTDLPALSAPGEPSPAEVPFAKIPYPPNAHFYGRADALSALRARLLSPNGGAVALVGMGGVGKTQMAVEYAHAYLMNYPGGIYWLDARSDERLLADYAALAKQFGMSEKLGIEDAAIETRAALDRLEKPALVIFDNVTEKTDLLLLPSSGRLHLLLTTQQQKLPANIFIMETPRLSESASLQLLQVFRQPPNDKEREAAREIVRLVGSLPLALALASHHIRALGCSFTEYLRRLTGEPLKTLQKGRDHFITATSHVGSIYDTIDLAARGEKRADASSRGLNNNALKILTAAACFAPASIPTDLLFQAAGIRDRDAFESALISLWGRSLLTREQDESAEERQFVHELIREYAKINLAPARRGKILSHIACALLERLRAANQALDWTLVRSDMAHCYAVGATAQDKTPPPALEELLLEIGIYLADHRDCKNALKYYTDGMELATRRREGDSLLFAKFLRLIGEAQEQEGAGAEALRCVRAARLIARNKLAKHDPAMADYCNSLGYVLKKQGHLKRARPFYLHALTIHQAQPESRQGDVAVLNNIGTLLEDQGDLSEALNYFERALESAEKAESGETIHAAYCLNNAGRVLSKMERWQEALLQHDRAREMFESAQGALHPDTAACWFYIAEAQRGLKRPKEARSHYQRALRIYEKEFGPSHTASQKTRDRLASLEAGED